MSQYRGHEMPMDFEFQNKTGPLDHRSPFAQVGQNVQRLPPRQTPSKRRGPNSFDSPSHQFQSSPNKPLPSVPAFNALYNTPRKINNDLDDSSAGETPQSRAADSDATPDNVGYRTTLSKFDSMSLPAVTKQERPKASPAKEKEKPTSSISNSNSNSNPSQKGGFFAKMKRLYSPGRGEIARSDHNQTMEKRVRKRRERELQRQVVRRRRHSISDSGDDSEQAANKNAMASTISSPRKISRGNRHDRSSSPEASAGASAAGPPKSPSVLTTLYTFIGQHPSVPYVLSDWAYHLFVVFFWVGCAWIMYAFYATVRDDVAKKSYEAIADVVVEMATCAREYEANRCDPSTRAPALATVCDTWYKCANRNPEKIGRATVSARTFADILNSFFDQMSYKTMVFCVVLAVGFWTTSISLFKAGATQFHQPHQYYGPPPTPQRNFSGQEHYGTPWHPQAFNPYPGLEPQPSGGFAQIEGRGSPVRKLVYN